MQILKRILVLTLVSTQAHAAIERPVVAGPDVDDSEFHRFVETHDRHSLSEYLDAGRPGAVASDRLRSELERAQRAWLGGSVDVARTAFAEIASLASLADWRDPQREVILYAHLRSAQLAETPLVRADWLAKAAKLVPDLEPDASLFPPPLIAEFKEARANANTRSTPIMLRDVFPGYRFVFVDGRKIALDSSSVAKISAGPHRVTAVSDRHAPITETMTAAQLAVFRVKVTSLVESCTSPATALPDGTTYDIFDGEDCHRDPLEKNVAASSPWSPAPTEVKTRAKRDWLWIGAAALGTAVAVAIVRSQKKSEPQSVHREGF